MALPERGADATAAFVRGHVAGVLFSIAAVASIDATGGPHTPDLPWWADAAACVAFGLAWLRCEWRALGASRWGGR